jgi:hypothetical protein
LNGYVAVLGIADEQSNKAHNFSEHVLTFGSAVDMRDYATRRQCTTHGTINLHD